MNSEAGAVRMILKNLQFFRDIGPWGFIPQSSAFGFRCTTRKGEDKRHYVCRLRFSDTVQTFTFALYKGLYRYRLMSGPTSALSRSMSTP